MNHGTAAPALSPTEEAAIDRLTPLLEPARRRAFGFVARSGRAVTRDETAAGTGVSLALATFHLEKLVQAGLLEVAAFEGASPVGIPGGRRRGRPAKLYRASRSNLSVSFPARNYRLAAELLADALAQGAVPDSLASAARARGRELGERAISRAERDGELDAERDAARGGELEAAVFGVLADQGYEPRLLEDGSVALGNCPFEGLTERHGGLICPANQALLDGVLDGARVTSMRTALDPGDGRCCVVLRAADEA